MALSQTGSKKLNDFAEGGSGPAPPPPKGLPQAKTLGKEPRSFKVMLYGRGGSGKTYALIPLLLDGVKLFVVHTDIGGDGLATVEAGLRYLGREDLLENVVYVTLPNYEAMETFLKDPVKVFPSIYEWNPDFIVWEGFSNYQANHVLTYVETDPTVLDRDGNIITLKYWGAVKLVTGRNFNRFFNLHNRKTGAIWHKLVTCLEDDKADSSKMAAITDPLERMKISRDVKAPMVQGAAANLMIPAFDVVLRARRMVKMGDDKVKLVKYVYETLGDSKLEAKVRGLQLEPVMPADFGEIWKLVKKYLGVVPGAKGEIVDGTD